MFSEGFVLKKYHIISLVIAGSIARIIFGLVSQIWNMAYDQIAWSMCLQEMVNSGTVSYKQMIHYPYEGGTFPISIIALILMPFVKTIPALSLTALVADSVSRYVQIKISQHLFGSFSALWFGIWTVMAVPELLPWGMAFFGLHSVTAVLCFIFLYYAVKPSGYFSAPVTAAIVVALTLMFSYHNIILIPAYFVWVFIMNGSLKIKLTQILKFTLCLALCLVPHLLIRLYVDHGFTLEGFALMSARNRAWDDVSFLQGIINLGTIWYISMPASLFLSTFDFLSPSLHRFISLGFILLSFLFLMFKDKTDNYKTRLAMLIIFFFTLSYGYSLFFTGEIGNTSFYVYRHFSYIIPLLVVLIIHRLCKSGKTKMITLMIWITFCFSVSLCYLIKAKPTPEPSYKVIGWILSRKHGDNVKMLSRLQDVAPENVREDLMFGFGWGISANLLRGKDLSDSMQVIRLAKLYNQIPSAQKKICADGIYYSFEPWITPTLNPKLFPLVKRHVKYEAD